MMPGEAQTNVMVGDMDELQKIEAVSKEEFEKRAMAKYEALKELLSEYNGVAVSYSAGVDSTFLLATAFAVLGEKAVAMTAELLSVPKRDIEQSRAFCHQNGITQLMVPFSELAVPGFAGNPPNRCYLCKKALFNRLIVVAAQNGISDVIEGSNADDAKDYRPGAEALKELGIRSPLKECGFTKEEIRYLSREMDLPTADKPSAACLSSRIPYGEEITEEKLFMVDRAEQLLRDLGLVTVRVRMHGTIARIETKPEEFEKLMRPGIRERVTDTLREIGFSYVTLDLLGYRMGSLNEVLD